MIIIEASDDVLRVWGMFAPGIKGLARRLTRDADLRKDLVQEAMIVLWEKDPTRFDLTDKWEFAYLRRALANRVRDVWRAELSRSARSASVFSAGRAGEPEPYPAAHPDYVAARCRRSYPIA